MKRYLIELVAIAMWATVLSGHIAFGASQQSPYTAFAGNWYFHGGILRITPGGSGFESFRTYVNCTPTRQTACDMVIGNIIYDGGYFRFKLHRVTGGKAHGTVTDSAYSWQVGTPITLVRAKKGTLKQHALAGPLQVCGPKSPPGYCGA